MGADSRTVLDRPAPPPSYTIRYGDGPEHIADVWIPAHQRPVPIVLLLHGGFWRHQWDRVHLRPMASALAAEYVVATPEYRRTGAPGGGWPGTFDDVRAAVASVPALIADRTPVDGRLILSGHSAGGQLALWARAVAPAAGTVALAPVADLRAAYRLDLGGGAVADLLGGSPEEVPERFDDTDPLVRVAAGGPIVVVHGGRDTIVPPDFSVRYAEAARAAGVDVRLHLPDAGHFDVIDPQCPVWSVILGAFAEVAHVDGGHLSR
jgi:acetyl esterase/lipase